MTLGVLPQCGFSAAASSLYAGRVITVGTLLAIYLSTSDEMLPILISQSVPIHTIAKILAAKVLIAVISGFFAEWFYIKALGRTEKRWIFMRYVKKKSVIARTVSSCPRASIHCAYSVIFF